MAAASKKTVQKLTLELFNENILNSRLSSGKSILNFPFEKRRCRILSECESVKEDAKGIIYWMSRDCRVQDNWALLYAQRLALKNDLPLIVCFLIHEAHLLYPTRRQFGFLLKGLQCVETECKSLNIPFCLLNTGPEGLVNTINDQRIGGLVCDFSPLKTSVKWQNDVLKLLPEDVPLIQVDSHNVVPCWEASNKQEIMAKTIRPKITKLLPEYLTNYPSVAEHQYSSKFETKYSLKKLKDAFKYYQPQHEVDEITWAQPTPEDGLKTLFSFVQERLQHYGISSNDPSKDATSNLSPWLHFGFISAQRCALEVQRCKEKYKEQVDKFLEELIVRRELAENYCFYNSNYDNINGAADWAIKTLTDHKKDKRPWIYSRHQLEKAQTHDEFWNAAQLQLVQDGKIHGYMRMYWCKKILEWTESPEQAIEFGLWLNDIYSVDGSDPNGFVGVMWSICCVHDQGWKEREVFGKIRYMVDYSLQRKFDMEAYCARFGRKPATIKRAQKQTKKVKK